jgi:hypothetical protein
MDATNPEQRVAVFGRDLNCRRENMVRVDKDRCTLHWGP